MSDNLFERFRAGMSEPLRPFIRLPNGFVITYGDLIARSGQYANALLNLGVEPGDRVAVQAEKSAELILLYLGCLRAGAVYLPLNTAYTLAETEYFIGDAQPRVLVCAPRLLGGVLPLAQRLGVAHVVTLGTDSLGADGKGGSLAERADAQEATFFDVARGSEDLAAILYTSGTTGRSKGAMLTHGNLASNAYCLKASWRYTASDILLHALPLFHVHGLFVAVHITLAAGASMILLPAFDVDAIMEHLPAATVFMGVPTYYVRLLQHAQLNLASAAQMRLFVSGSAPLLVETHRDWLARTGHAILERYGMSETGINTSNPYGGERVPGTVGLPLSGVALRVVDLDSGAPVSQGTVGMLEVKGPNVFAGYWRMPDKTRAEFRDDGYFVTGDIGKFDERGFVHIVGRSKDLIVTGGYNVYPKEVEIELDLIPGVAESAVFGVAHPDFGEAVSAAVIRLAAATAHADFELTEAALLSRLRSRLAGYKCPKRVVFVDELPRNAMGKVMKNLLREQFANLYQVPT